MQNQFIVYSNPYDGSWKILFCRTINDFMNLVVVLTHFFLFMGRGSISFFFSKFDLIQMFKWKLSRHGPRAIP